MHLLWNQLLCNPSLLRANNLSRIRKDHCALTVDCSVTQWINVTNCMDSLQDTRLETKVLQLTKFLCKILESMLLLPQMNYHLCNLPKFRSNVNTKTMSTPMSDAILSSTHHQAATNVASSSSLPAHSMSTIPFCSSVHSGTYNLSHSVFASHTKSKSILKPIIGY